MVPLSHPSLSFGTLDNFHPLTIYTSSPVSSTTNKPSSWKTNVESNDQSRISSLDRHWAIPVDPVHYLLLGTHLKLFVDFYAPLSQGVSLLFIHELSS